MKRLQNKIVNMTTTATEVQPIDTAQKKPPEALLHAKINAGEGIRTKTEEVLNERGLMWKRIDQLLRENNEEMADQFLAELKLINPEAGDAEKTKALIEIMGNYSEGTVGHTKWMRGIIEKLEASKLSKGGEIFEDINLKQLAETVPKTHDIGKIVMPDRILNKGGKYTAEDHRIKEVHPVMGYLILRALDFKDKNSVRFALTHHLRYKTQDDGTVVLDGYPKDAFLRYCEETGREPELNAEDHLAAFADVFSAKIDPDRPTDSGSNKVEDPVRQYKESLEWMDRIAFKDHYYQEGEGAPLYSAFKEAMMQASKNPRAFLKAA